MLAGICRKGSLVIHLNDIYILAEFIRWVVGYIDKMYDVILTYGILQWVRAICTKIIITIIRHPSRGLLQKNCKNYLYYIFVYALLKLFLVQH